MDEDTQRLMREISTLAATTMGKRNKQHIMMKSMNSVSITTSSKYYMEQICLQYNHNIMMKIFLQVLSTHHKTQGDAGWLCITLATHLLSTSCKRDIPAYALIRGLNLACQLAIDEMQSVITPIALTLDWGEPTQVLCLLMSLFRPHQSTTHLSEDDMECLAKTLLGTFISSLSDGSDGSLSPHVVFHSSSLTLTLPNEACCQHLEGSLLIDIPLPRSFPYNGARDVLVVVFEESLELPEQLTNISIEGHTTATSLLPTTTETKTKTIMSVKELEYKYLEEMCDIIVRSNIGLVCCQRRIHPHLQRLLSLKGIVCVPRLSIRYINAVLRLSGAKQLGAFPQIQTLQTAKSTTTMPLSVSSLGFLHRIYMRYIGEKPFLAIQQSRLYDDDEDIDEDTEEDKEVADEVIVLTRLLKNNKRAAEEILSRRIKFSTLLLVGGDANLCREIEYMCMGACKVLTQLINGTSSATVLPGGGCWQAYIATHVRRKLQLVQETEKQGHRHRHRHRDKSPTGKEVVSSGLDVGDSDACRGKEEKDDDDDEEKEEKEEENMIGIDDPEGFLLSVAPLSPSRDINRAALLFCEALEYVAMLVGGEVTNRAELETFLQTLQTVTPSVSDPQNQHGWGGFSWSSPPSLCSSSSSSSSSSSFSSPSSSLSSSVFVSETSSVSQQWSCRFTNAMGCVIETKTESAETCGNRIGDEMSNSNANKVTVATKFSSGIQRADVLDALLPCVSALQVAVEAVTSVVDIDGLVESVNK